MSETKGRRLDAALAVTALPDGAELVALVPDTATPGRKVVRRIGKAAVVGVPGPKGDRGDTGPSGAADGIPPSALAAGAALSASDGTYVIQGEEAKYATLGAVAAAQGISLASLAPAGAFADADTVLVGQGGEAKRTTLADLVAHVASKIGGSGGASASPDQSVPGQVTGLTATVPNSVRVNLAWAAVSGAAGYKVERALAGAGDWATIGTVTDGTAAAATSLSPATGYDFRVSAYNGAGSGAPSATVSATTQAAPTTAPGQVTGLTATATSDRRARLVWAATPGATSYRVERSAAGANTWTALASGVTSTDYDVSGLTRGTGYDFRVTASNANGSGTPSASATITTPTVPGQVLNLRPGPFAATDTTLPVQWDALLDATYKIEHSTDGGATWIAGTATSTNTTYIDLTAGTTRRFRVSASYDGTTFGPVSAVLTASTSGGAGASPQGGTASGTGFAGVYDALDFALLGLWDYRRVRSAHTGALTTVRRASDGATQDIGYAAAGDWDTAAIAAFCGTSDGTLAKLYDQSGNGVHLAQTDPAKQPKVYDGASGAMVPMLGSTKNRPAPRNPGDTGRHLESAAVLPALGSAATVFGLAAMRNAEDVSGAIAAFRNGSTLTVALDAAGFYDASKARSYLGGGTQLAEGMPRDRPIAFAATADGAVGHLYVDGDEGNSSGNAATAPLPGAGSAILYGGRGTAAARDGLIGSLGPLLIAPVVLTAAQRAAVRTPALDYYG